MSHQPSAATLRKPSRLPEPPEHTACRAFRFETSWGPVELSWTGAGLSRIDLSPQGAARNSSPADWVLSAATRIKDYLLGKAVSFHDLPLDLSLLTEFQRLVLDRTRAIPRGEVVSYGELARALGKPKAARAVGGALARNPIPLVIPCHRVVAKDGDLRGFSAPGGLRSKAALLALEKVPAS